MRIYYSQLPPESKDEAKDEKEPPHPDHCPHPVDQLELWETQRCYYTYTDVRKSDGGLYLVNMDSGDCVDSDVDMVTFYCPKCGNEVDDVDWSFE